MTTGGPPSELRIFRKGYSLVGAGFTKSELTALCWNCCSANVSMKPKWQWLSGQIVIPSAPPSSEPNLLEAQDHLVLWFILHCVYCISPVRGGGLYLLLWWHFSRRPRWPFPIRQMLLPESYALIMPLVNDITLIFLHRVSRACFGLNCAIEMLWDYFNLCKFWNSELSPW